MDVYIRILIILILNFKIRYYSYAFSSSDIDLYFKMCGLIYYIKEQKNVIKFFFEFFNLL